MIPGTVLQSHQFILFNKLHWFSPDAHHPTPVPVKPSHLSHAPVLHDDPQAGEAAHGWCQFHSGHHPDHRPAQHAVLIIGILSFKISGTSFSAIIVFSDWQIHLNGLAC
jgi:hypothetical protein